MITILYQVILCFLVASESLIKLTSASGISEETFQDLQRAAKLSSAAYAKCDTNAYDVTITKHINDIATGTQGYIGYSTSRRAISLVFRGSTTVIDFVNDLDSTTVSPTIPDTHFPTGAKIMQGIHRPWLAVHNDVISEIRNLLGQYPEFSLESMGHSLGGSLTYLSYIVLKQSFPHTNITGYALAAFPIGNQEFADLGTMQGGNMFRGNSKGDGTPNEYVNKPWNFKHYGMEYYSDGSREGTIQCQGNQDPACSAGNGVNFPTLAHFHIFGVDFGLLGSKSECN
ncbi:Alpha/Beta hydrolase protein [Aspergillus transmontanensis]|uniref:Alpha/Beta hydrolase protein n=1 Tax=Aspergillus transmontanensis TaxID=1034304 RepID=A0A5N6WFU8_9EURO|nr:Alpha/Beta hydrolase protein [Aspergillus transmontanensis]